MMTVTASTATTIMMAGYIMAPLICLAVLRALERSLATRVSISSSLPDASAARIRETRMVGNTSGYLASTALKSSPSHTSALMRRTNSATSFLEACSANVSSDSASGTPVRSITASCWQKLTTSSLPIARARRLRRRTGSDSWPTPDSRSPSSTERIARPWRRSSRTADAWSTASTTPRTMSPPSERRAR